MATEKIARGGQVITGLTTTFQSDMVSRRFAFTSWQEVPPEYDESWIQYLLVGKETCPTSDRQHWQGYVETKSRLTQASCEKKLGGGDGTMRLRSARADVDKNQVYCSKDGEWIEWGEPFSPGERTDLVELVEAIWAGEITVAEIMRQEPHMYHQYGRTLRDNEDGYLGTRKRDKKPVVRWYYGKSGSGKSHTAHEEAGPDACKWSGNDHGWWDKYKGQKHLVMDEFRGNLQLSYLLELLDKYPFSVPHRGREPFPMLATDVWITSDVHPSQIYKNDGNIEQLLRRIDILKEFTEKFIE